MDLSTVKTREKLKPKHAPYWQRIAPRQFIGYRISKPGTAGVWSARYYDADARKNRYETFGAFAELPANERFSAAKKSAEQWFDHLRGGGDHKSTTVREVCGIYAEGRPDAAQRFKQFVYGDSIAKVMLHKLTKFHVREWRQRMESTPALLTRSKDGKPETRKRSEATINRDMVPMRAALNKAHDDGRVLTDIAWRVELRPFKNAGRRRNLYLDLSQRRALVANFEPEETDIATFTRGLSVLPLRPGALAALRVSDFDARRSELVISRDKHGVGRKIILPSVTVTFLRELSRNKLPAAPLFTRLSGTDRAGNKKDFWDKDAWKWPIKDAALKAKLPPSTSAYTLRHSTITDMVTGGLPLLTVAQISGTSVAMIERHYGHLVGTHAAEALAKLAL